MNRRKYLSIVGTSTFFSGCTALGGTKSESDTNDEILTVSAPTVTPGENATITLEAQSVSHLRFDTVPDVDIVEYENAEFSAHPTTTYQMSPPTWIWSLPKTLSGTIPITVPDTTTPEAHQYSIVMKSAVTEEVVTETFTITVEE